MLGEFGGGNAARESHGLTACGFDFSDDGGGGFGVQVIDDDVGTFAGEFQGDAAPDATASAGDEGDAAFEFSAHFLGSFRLLKEGVLRALPLAGPGQGPGLLSFLIHYTPQHKKR